MPRLKILKEETESLRFDVPPYQVVFSYPASWAAYNRLAEGRESLRPFLKKIVKNVVSQGSRFQPRVPTFYRVKSYGVTINLVIVADSPDDDPRYLLVTAVQTPVAKESGRNSEIPASVSYANCHVTAEVHPASTYSLLPINFRFIRGETPTRIHNFAVTTANGRGKPSYFNIGDRDFVTNFKHFVSAAYSSKGLIYVDFLLSIPHTDTAKKTDFPFVELPKTRQEFEAQIKSDVNGPLKEITDFIYQDQGSFFPTAAKDIEDMMNAIASDLGNEAISKLGIYKTERETFINPGMHNPNFGTNLSLPEEMSVFEERITRFLASLPALLNWLHPINWIYGLFGLTRFAGIYPQVKKSVIDLINTAQSSVRIVSGELSEKFYQDPEVLKAFNDLLERSVEIEIIHGPRKNRTSANRLQLPGLHLIQIPRRPKTHFVIVDGKNLAIEDYHVPGEKKRSLYIHRNAVDLGTFLEGKFEELKNLKHANGKVKPK